MHTGAIHRRGFCGSPIGIGAPTNHLFERHVGIVKSWLDDKRYGFVTDGKPGSDIFVHFRDLKCEDMSRKMLHIGEEVEMDVEEEGGKRRGHNVTGIDGVPLKGGNIKWTEPVVMQSGTKGSRFYRRGKEIRMERIKDVYSTNCHQKGNPQRQQSSEKRPEINQHKLTDKDEGCESSKIPSSILKYISEWIKKKLL